jgi:hypothetical protein
MSHPDIPSVTVDRGRDDRGVGDWERPYRVVVEPLFVLVLMGAVAGLAVCGSVTTSHPLGSFLLSFSFYVLWLFGLWRVGMVGVHIGPEGIRVQRVRRTYIIPWDDVDRLWIGPAQYYDATTIWITTVGGVHIETPLWRKGSRSRFRNRVPLHPDDFYQAFVRLKAGRAASGRY